MQVLWNQYPSSVGGVVVPSDVSLIQSLYRTGQGQYQNFTLNNNFTILSKNGTSSNLPFLNKNEKEEKKGKQPIYIFSPIVTFPFLNAKFQKYEKFFLIENRSIRKLNVGEKEISLFTKRDKSLWYFLSFFYYKGTLSPLVEFEMVELLIDSFFKTAFFRKEVECGYKKISGIYIIFNRSNYTCYIGETVDILNRLNTHFLELTEGKHSNKRMQTDVDQKGLNHFYPLILDYGPNFLLKEERLKVEKEWIQKWPGPVYNIMNKKKT